MKILLGTLLGLLLFVSAHSQTIAVEIKVYYVSWSGYVGDEYGPRFRLYRDQWNDSYPYLLTDPCIKFSRSSSGSGYPDRTVYTYVNASSPTFTLLFVSHEERKDGSDDCTSQGVSTVTTNKPDRFQPSTPDSEYIDLRNYTAGNYHQFEMNNDDISGTYTRAIIQFRYAPVKPNSPTTSAATPIDVLSNTTLTAQVTQPNTNYLTYEWEYHFTSEDVTNPAWTSCRNSCISQCIACQGSTPGSSACTYPCGQCSTDCSNSYPQYLETWHPLGTSSTNSITFQPMQAIFSSGICGQVSVNFRVRVTTSGLDSDYTSGGTYYTFEPKLTISYPAGANLCGSEAITLTGTSGYASYKWQYQADAGSWTDLSGFTAYQIASKTGQEILGTSAFASNVGKNIRFRYTINACNPATKNSGSSAQYAFYPPGPTVSGTPVSPHCVGGSNGGIQITHGSLISGQTYNYSITQWIPQTTGPCPVDPAGQSTPTGYCYGGKSNAINETASTSFLVDTSELIDKGIAFKRGRYTIKVEAQSGKDKGVSCATTQDFIIADPTAMEVTVSSKTSPNCVGGNDGTANFSIQNGYGTEGFSWSINTTPVRTSTTSVRTFPIESLSTNSYTVTVRDIYCDLTDDVVVPIPTSSTTFRVTSSNAANPTCYTSSSVGNGSFDVSVNKISTHDTGYSYKLLNDLTVLQSSAETDRTASFSSLNHHITYKVRATSPNGCKDSTTVKLSAPPAINGTLTPTANVCAGGSAGKITFNKTSGSADTNLDYTIQKQDGSGVFQNYTTATLNETTREYSGLPEGIYRVTIKDNCLTYSSDVTDTKTPADVFVDAPDPMTFVTTSGFILDNDEYIVPCFDDRKSLKLGIQNGTAPYTVVLKDGTTTVQTDQGSTINYNLPLSNNYVVTVSDFNCPNTSDISLDFKVKSDATSIITATIKKLKYDNNKDNVINSSDYHLTCLEKDDGRINLVVNGGVPSGTPNYTVELLNASGAPILNNNENTTADPDGTITGTTSTYDFTRLKENIQYRVRVTDKHNNPLGSAGCTKTFLLDETNNNLTLTSPDSLWLSGPNINSDFSGLKIYNGSLYVSCKDQENGKYTPQVKGGNPTYTINLFKRDSSHHAWPSTPFRTANGVTASAMPTFDGLGAGFYKVTVVDQWNCRFVQKSFEIKEALQPIQVTSITAKQFSHGFNTKCYGDSTGEITVAAEGGVGQYSYNLKSDVGHNVTSKKAEAVHTFTNLPALKPSGQKITYTISLFDEIACNWQVTNGVPNTIQLNPPDTVEFSWQVASRTVAGFEIPCYRDSAIVRFTSEGGEYIHTVTIDGVTPPKTISSNTSHVDFELPAGTYTANFQDKLGCPAPAQTIVLRHPASHVQIVPGDLIPPVCIGGNNGKINISATNGVQSTPSAQAYSFVLKKSNSLLFDTDTLKGLSVQFLRPANFYNDQEYTLRAIDKHKCISDSVVVLKRNPTPLKISFDTIASPSCYGGNDGFIKVRASNYEFIAGTSLKFKLSGGHLDTVIIDTLVMSDTITFKKLQGTDLEQRIPYRAWIEDFHACADTADQYNDALILPSYDPVGLDVIQMIRPSCYNGDDGSLYVKVSGGVPPYRYSRDNNSFQNVNSDSTFFVNNLKAGDFKFFIRDIQYKSDQPACQILDTLEVAPGRFIRIEGEAQPVSCKGGADGSLKLNTYIDHIPATENFEASRLSQYWTHDNISSLPIDTAKAISGLSAGTFTAHVSYDVDSLVCKSKRSFIVQEPTSPFYISAIDTYPSSCGSYHDGKALVSVSGGWADSLSYFRLDSGTWQLFQGNFVLTNLSPGQHSVDISQSNFTCNSTKTFTIEAAKLSIAVDSIISPTCPGDADGVVVLSSTNHGVLYAQEGGSFEPLGVFDGLSAGTYRFVAQKSGDATCQSNVVEAIVADPVDCGEGPLVLTLLTKLPTTCDASADGRAQVRASGGVPPYRYYWDDSSVDTGDTANSLVTGRHTVLVKDDLDSVELVSFEIYSLDPLEADPYTALASCESTCDGKITVVASKGSGSYAIKWAGSDHQGFERDGLCANEYEFTVSDNLNPTCFVTKKAVLEHYPSLVISEETAVAPTCPGGTNGYVSIQVAGGSGSYNYSWNNGVTSRKNEGHVPGEYLVTVTDKVLECSTQSLHSIPDAIPITVVSTLVTAPLCHGNKNGKAELVLQNASSPLIKWQNGNIGLRCTGVPAGIQTYTITSSQGCTYTGLAEIPDRPALTVEVNVDSVTCNGACDGAIALKPMGGTSPYFVKWDHGPVLASLGNLCSGSYRYTISDNNKCNIGATIEVATPEKISIAATIKNPTCFGNNDGEASVAVQGGIGPYAYMWSTGSEATQITAIVDGDYSVVVTDQNECVASASVSLKEPDALVLFNINLKDPSCPASSDGTISFDLTGGTAPYEYTWEDGNTSPDHEALPAGDYSIVIEDLQGCILTRDFTLTKPEGLQIVNVEQNDPHCFGEANGSISLEVTGGSAPLEYDWSDGTSVRDIDDKKAGEYVLTITDSKACSVDRTFTLIDPAVPVITGLQSSIIICTGGTAADEPAGEWSAFQWRGPDEFSSNVRRLETSNAGEYTLTAWDGNGCPATASLDVVVSPNALVIDFLRISEAVAFEPIIFVDISQPVPSLVEWLVPDSPDITINSQSSSTLELLFTKAGSYEIGMHAALDNCNSELYKIIQIVEPDPEGRVSNRPNINEEAELDITLYPNPASQSLQVRIHTSERDPIEIKLLSTVDNRTITADVVEGYLDYLIDLDINHAKAGVYYLIYEQNDIIRSKRIVVIK